MLSKTEKARINKELKGLANEYQRSYEVMQQASEAQYKTTLKPGAVFRPQQGFYFEEDRRAFNETCDHLRAKAHDLIDKIALDVMAQNTAAPSTEAVNVVTLINARQNVSAEEIDQLMTKYGHDCPMVYKALHEKAVSLGYHDFKPHPIAEEAESMEAMTNLIDRTFTADRAEHSNMAATIGGFYSMTDAAFNSGE